MRTTADVTINMCTVDRTGYGVKAIESLVEHTPHDATLQLIFNGSTDEHVEALQAAAAAWTGEYRECRIDPIVDISSSHQRALELCTTSLIQFMGDDDVVLGPRLEPILAAFNDNDPTPLAVTSWARRISGSLEPTRVGSFKDLGPTTIDDWRAQVARREQFEMLWPGAVLDVEAALQVGFEQGFGFTIDNRLFTRLALMGPVLAVPDRNFGFRVHGGSFSSKFAEQQEVVRWNQACMEALLDGHPEPTLEEFRRSPSETGRWNRLRHTRSSRARSCLRSAGAEILDGEITHGLRDVAKATIAWPPAVAPWVMQQVGHRRSSAS